MLRRVYCVEIKGWFGGLIYFVGNRPYVFIGIGLYI